MEDLLWKYPGDFFPPRYGFKPAARQFTLSDGGRLDISFRDASERLWVVEVKATAIRTEVADQIYRYARNLKEAHPHDTVIPAVVAPVINSTVRDHFDRWGIEYFEINEATFRRVATERGIEVDPQEPSVDASASGVARVASVATTRSVTRSQWGWEKYRTELGWSAQHIEEGQELMAILESIAKDWRPDTRFNKGYVSVFCFGREAFGVQVLSKKLGVEVWFRLDRNPEQDLPSGVGTRQRTVNGVRYQYFSGSLSLGEQRLRRLCEASLPQVGIEPPASA